MEFNEEQPLETSQSQIQDDSYSYQVVTIPTPAAKNGSLLKIPDL